MYHFIAFLRGVNLGRRRIKMEVLRAEFEAMAFSSVETFIASGNVIFSSATGDDRKLARQIEQHLQGALGYEVDTFVRTRAEVAAVAALQPFSAMDMGEPANTVHVGFLPVELGVDRQRGLAACRSDTDEFYVEGREYYWLCRGIKTHESRIWASPALKALRLPSSTMRNLRTVRKLADLYPAG